MEEMKAKLEAYFMYICGKPYDYAAKRLRISERSVREWAKGEDWKGDRQTVYALVRIMAVNELCRGFDFAAMKAELLKAVSKIGLDDLRVELAEASARLTAAEFVAETERRLTQKSENVKACAAILGRDIEAEIREATARVMP